MYLEQLDKNNKAVMLAAVRHAGGALNYASKYLQNDTDVVMEAIKQNGLAFKYASKRLKNDINIVMEAVKRSCLAFEHASDRLKADPACQFVARHCNRFDDEQWPVIKAYLMAEPNLDLLLAFDNPTSIYALALSCKVGEVKEEPLPELGVDIVLYKRHFQTHQAHQEPNPTSLLPGGDTHAPHGTQWQGAHSIHTCAKDKLYRSH